MLSWVADLIGESSLAAAHAADPTTLSALPTSAVAVAAENTEGIDNCGKSSGAELINSNASSSSFAGAGVLQDPFSGQSAAAVT